MFFLLSVLLGLFLILNGAVAVVQHNKLRESRRRQARSLSLALAASERFRTCAPALYVCPPESAGVAQRQQRLVPGIALMNIGSQI
jgi:hypothetical protein